MPAGGPGSRSNASASATPSQRARERACDRGRRGSPSQTSVGVLARRVDPRPAARRAHRRSSSPNRACDGQRFCRRTLPRRHRGSAAASRAAGEVRQHAGRCACKYRFTRRLGEAGMPVEQLVEVSTAQRRPATSTCSFLRSRRPPGSNPRSGGLRRGTSRGCGAARGAERSTWRTRSGWMSRRGRDLFSASRSARGDAVASTTTFRLGGWGGQPRRPRARGLPLSADQLYETGRPPSSSPSVAPAHPDRPVELATVRVALRISSIC